MKRTLWIYITEERGKDKMKYSKPEKMGIKSSDIKEYIEVLENANLSTHDLIIMRHGEIVFEKYWKPFHKDFLHRMYSVTKSFVSLGIGFAEQDGLINLDDPLVKYFPKEAANITDENVKNQTIRDMLMMATARVEFNWFENKTNDRVQQYFDNPHNSRPSGTVFNYDSCGSFMLGALIERVTGKELIEYLREKFLDKIGFSKEAFMLKCPGGHSWGDSALICKPTDLLKTAMFCMNMGEWNGEQILNKEYMVNATKKQIDNNSLGLDSFESQGYGYQIWRTYDNSFFFNGMGAQLTVCVPDKDIIMVYNADNQGNGNAKTVVMNNFFDMIVRRAEDCEIADSGYDELMAYADSLELYKAKGSLTSEVADKINGVTYKMYDNPMGITEMKVSFDGNKGELYYINEQGEKRIPFGMCYNEFSEFPQEGYSDMVGTQKGNRLYKCAASAAWADDKRLFIKVQIIDTYFGNLNIMLGFNDNKIGVEMTKTAEDFLREYEGYGGGTAC